MTVRPASPPPSPLLVCGLIALAYFVTGRVGLGIYIAEGTATLVWAPTGIAIAAIMLFGGRVAWPGIFTGAMLVNLGIGLPLAGAVPIAVGNTLEALAAGWLLKRVVGDRNPFDHVRGNLHYLLLAGLLATQVSALVGAATTIALNIRPAGEFANLWLLWWVGDVAGALLLAPPIYLLGRRWLERHDPDRHLLWGMTGRHGEFAAVLALAVLSSLAIHAGWLPELAAAHLSWLPFLVVLWGARRLSPLATMTTSLAVSMTAIGGVLAAGSLADRETVNERLIYLYAFLFMQSVAALIASALVHERRVLVAELVRAREEAQRASEQKTRFLANMSHEIRTPLNGIIGMTSLLESDIHEQRQREQLRIIHASADSLLNILNDILDHARLESGKLVVEPRTFELLPLVRDVTGLFQPQAELKGIVLRARVDGNVPAVVRADDNRLRQVLVNVLSNAVKFTPQGSVILHASLDEATPVHLVFTVTDTGIGIPEDAIDRVFEAFTQADGSTTRRYGGSGLGLTISKQLVEHMGGTLTILSAPGNGTTVTIRLPLPA